MLVMPSMESCLVEVISDYQCLLDDFGSLTPSLEAFDYFYAMSGHGRSVLHGYIKGCMLDQMADFDNIA